MCLDKDVSCKECQEAAQKAGVYEKDSWICEDCNVPDKPKDKE